MVCVMLFSTTSYIGIVAAGHEHEIEAQSLTSVPSGYTGIYNASQLNNIRSNLSGKYILMNNIDLSSYGYWTPIGSNYDTAFTGVFDGNQYTITGMSIFMSAEEILYCGLFGYSLEATIKNTGFVNSQITAVVESSTLQNKYLYAGIIVGSNDNGTVTNCFANKGNINARSGAGTCYIYAGGITGENYNGNISLCYNTGYVGSYSQYAAYSGGIAGISYNTIAKCYNFGAVSSESAKYYATSGGIIGYGEGGNIDDCFNNGNVSACSAANISKNAIESTYEPKVVSSSKSVSINEIQMKSAQEPIAAAGGVIGYSNNCEVGTSYSVGKVSAVAYRNYAGGVIGINYGVANSVFYLDTVALSGSAYVGNEATDNVTGLTSSQLKNIASFSGFSNSIWTMGGNTNYPFPKLIGMPLDGIIPEDIAVESIFLTTESLSVPVGETSQLVATITPSDATNQFVTWSSSDENVATVNSMGLVTAKAPGTATITVTANDTMNGMISDSCSIIISTDTSNILIDRVSQYCYNFDSEEFLNRYKTWDLSKPSNLNELITENNKAADSYKERWDLIWLAGHDGVGGNETYAAWQYKEYINTIGIRTVLGLGGLIYNDEAVGYLVGEWAEKDKYKDALKKYMSACSSDIELLSYIDDTVSFLDDLTKVVGDIAKVNKIRQLQTSLRGCTSSLEVDNLLYKFDFSSNGFGSLTIDYVNNTLSKALGYVGNIIQVAQITAEGTIALMSVSKNLKIYQTYGDFLSGIASDLSLPCALRVGANELYQSINQQYAQALLGISQEIGKAVVSSGGSEILSASTMAASTALSSVLIGISIGKFVGNIFLGIDEIVKASAYTECYALLSERYSKIVLQDKNTFNLSPTYENAQKFRDDYTCLCNLRLIGEETYRDMVGFEKLWSKKIRNTLRSWSGFEEKNAFVGVNIERLKSNQFTMKDDAPIKTVDLVKSYTKTAVIACPVNVRVYNESNVLIGSVTNNVLDVGVSDQAEVPLIIYVSDDIKIIKIPEDANYRIEVSAFAEGEMSYTIEETDEDYNVLKRTNYYSLNIDVGDCFVINDAGVSNPDFHTLYSVDNNKKIEIAPSETFTGNSIVNATVNISVDVVNGGYVYGNGEYQKGDMVSLIATPELATTFKGWYDGNTLIASDDTLSFVATEDRQLRVIFCTKATVLNGITLSAESLPLQYKGTSKLTVTFNPTNVTNKNVTWASNNEKVAIVDANGNVTAKGSGTAMITATTEDGGKTASCTVTVKLIWWQWLIKILLFGWIWY